MDALSESGRRRHNSPHAARVTVTVRDLQEQSLALREELLRRRQDDALAAFKPHKKQAEFIDKILARKFKRGFFLAANRAGKSDAGAYVVSHAARYGWPDSETTYYSPDMVITDKAVSVWASSLDWPSSRDIVQPKLFNNGYGVTGRGHAPFIPDREIANWSPSQQILKMKSGSIIGFKSNDSGREKFQGTGKDLIWFDEEHDKDVYEESTIRVEAGRSLTVIVTCTMLPPEGVPGGVTWTYNDIIIPWKAGKLPDVLLVQASIYDNPFIAPDELRFLESIYPPGSLQRRIRLDGELLPGTGGARAFPGFDRDLHVRSQSEFWNPRRPLCWCWDFNIDPLITVVGQRDNGIFRAFDEFVTEGSSIDEMCEQVYDIYGRHRGEWLIYGDQTGQHRGVQTAETNYTLILNNMRSKGVACRLKLPSTNPFVRDRINAVNRQIKDERGELNIEVDPKCDELIMDLEQVQLDKRGGLRKVSDRSDPYAKRTHASDAWSYWLAYEAPVTQFTNNKRPTGPTKIKDPGYSFKRQ